MAMGDVYKKPAGGVVAPKPGARLDVTVLGRGEGDPNLAQTPAKKPAPEPERYEGNTGTRCEYCDGVIPPRTAYAYRAGRPLHPHCAEIIDAPTIANATIAEADAKLGPECFGGSNFLADPEPRPTITAEHASRILREFPDANLSGLNVAPPVPPVLVWQNERFKAYEDPNTATGDALDRCARAAGIAPRKTGNAHRETDDELRGRVIQALRRLAVDEDPNTATGEALERCARAVAVIPRYNETDDELRGRVIQAIRRRAMEGPPEPARDHTAFASDALYRKGDWVRIRLGEPEQIVAVRPDGSGFNTTNQWVGSSFFGDVVLWPEPPPERARATEDAVRIVRVYVAGASKEPERVRAMMDAVEALGCVQTLDWLRVIETEQNGTASPTDLESRRKYARDDLDAVEAADIVIVLASFENTTGSWCELQHAITIRDLRRGDSPFVIVAGPAGNRCIFASLADVETATDMLGFAALALRVSELHAEAGPQSWIE